MRKSRAWWVIFNTLGQGGMSQGQAEEEADAVYANLVARNYLSAEARKPRVQ